MVNVRVGSPPSGIRRRAILALSPYEAASLTGRGAAWLPPSVSPADAASYIDTLRRRARDAVRNNAYAARIVDIWASELVGRGIRPLSTARSADLQSRIQDLWEEWSHESDRSGVFDWYGIQSLVARAVVESGEAFVVFRPRRADSDLSVPLQIDVLEGDFVPATLNEEKPNGYRVVAGIEYDQLGQRVAYHMYRRHPLEMGGGGETVRVPASLVLHIFRRERPGQERGVPWLAPVLTRLHELDQYEDAELVRKKTSALTVGFIRTPFDDSSMLSTAEAGDKTDLGDEVRTMEPGTLVELRPGEDVTFTQPSDVGQSFEPFIKSHLRAIAVGVGLTYEQLSGDLSDVNFSSIRAGLIEFRRRCRALQQHVLIHQLCRPVWKKWIERAVMSGRIGLLDPRDMRARWVTEGWEWVDPQKEQAALQAAVRNGFMSRSQVVASMGRDVDEVDAEMKADLERADRLGLVYDTDPRKTNRTGAYQKEAV